MNHYIVTIKLSTKTSWSKVFIQICMATVRVRKIYFCLIAALIFDLLEDSSTYIGQLLSPLHSTFFNKK